MAAREPDSEPASVGDDDGEEDMSDEDAEAESEDDERKSRFQQLEAQLEAIKNQMGELKLLAFVKKYAGPPPEKSREQEYVAPTVKKAKKSKTMSRQDQDAQIAGLRGTLHHNQEGVSLEEVQSIETGAEDSDDETNQMRRARKSKEVVLKSPVLVI